MIYIPESSRHAGLRERKITCRKCVVSTYQASESSLLGTLGRIDGLVLESVTITLADGVELSLTPIETTETGEIYD